MEPRKVGAAKHAGLGPCNVHCYGYRVTVAEDESKNACWTGRAPCDHERSCANQNHAASDARKHQKEIIVVLERDLFRVEEDRRERDQTKSTFLPLLIIPPRFVLVCR